MFEGMVDVFTAPKTVIAYPVVELSIKFGGRPLLKRRAGKDHLSTILRCEYNLYIVRAGWFRLSRKGHIFGKEMPKYGCC